MRVAWGAIFLSLMFSVDSSSAQTVGASLQGTVYDPSGGYVPGASIEIRNVENGGVRTLTTDDHGRYREQLLPPGEYELYVKGARPEQNSFLLDGSDINNVYNKTPGSVAGVLLGVETVQEFQVLTNAYSAEFGRSAGGIINAITRSGANHLHGNLFGYLRNSALDAKNYFDLASSKIPPFKRNQFGGTLGEPMRHDKTFFFGAFEAVKERLGVTGLTNVLDDNARNSATGAVSSLVQFLFPRATGRVLGGGVAEQS